MELEAWLDSEDSEGAEAEDLVRRQEELEEVWEEVKEMKNKHKECIEMVAELQQEIEKCKTQFRR